MKVTALSRVCSVHKDAVGRPPQSASMYGVEVRELQPNGAPTLSCILVLNFGLWRKVTLGGIMSNRTAMCAFFAYLFFIQPDALIRHNIRPVCLILCRSPLCHQNCSDSSEHGLHKTSECVLWFLAPRRFFKCWKVCCGDSMHQTCLSITSHRCLIRQASPHSLCTSLSLG